MAGLSNYELPHVHYPNVDWIDDSTDLEGNGYDAPVTTPNPKAVGQIASQEIIQPDSPDYSQALILEEDSESVRLLIDDTDELERRVDSILERPGPLEYETVDDALAQGVDRLLESSVDFTGTLPGVLVEFKDLEYTGKLAEGSDKHDTFSNKIIACLAIWKRFKKHKKTILSNMEGSFRPGTTTLILGPPGCGKSTFMKVLGGQAIQNRKFKQSGSVSFNGKPSADVRVNRICGYIGQEDVHIPELTVGETTRFAAEWQMSERFVQEADLDPGLKAKAYKVESYIDKLVLTILGIGHVMETVVGSVSKRGISGGQRKRLTTAEMLVGRFPVLFADEISTGLDSAVTYDVSRTLGSMAHRKKATMIVALLQPTPETYSLYDEICLLTGGRLAYQGPRTAVKAYFNERGFKLPPKIDEADWIQEIVSGNGDIFAAGGTNAANLPKTPEEFDDLWRNSPMFKERRAEDEVLRGECAQREQQAISKKNYILRRLECDYSNKWMESVKICFKRQILLYKRNPALTIGKVMQLLIISLLLGTLFWQVDHLTESNLIFSVTFFLVLFLGLSSQATLPANVAQRAIVYKQLDANFYPASAYATAAMLMELPVMIMEVLIACCVVYWMVGYAPDVGRFFFFILTLLGSRFAIGNLYRFIAFAAPDVSAAQGVATCISLFISLFTGFVIAEGDIGAWYIWIYWVIPSQWAFTSLSLNEFYDPRYPGNTGTNILMIKGLTTEKWRKWAGPAYLFGFGILMIIAFFLVLKYIRWRPFFSAPSGKPKATGELGKNEIPFEPITLSFSELFYRVDLPDEKKGTGGLTLLNNINGFVKPGTMTALMGSSGAGKTTLMDVLAGRKNTGIIEGDIVLNGKPVDDLTFNRNAAYVEQNDIHSPAQTVKEAIEFSAKLRLPDTLSPKEKLAFADRIMKMLGLDEIENAVIGSPATGGLSVEQRKRLTIGVELAANPSMIFLDEPTSGLDARAARKVMLAVKNIVESGRTVICTIHQPNSEIFWMFDYLLLLKKGGETVFFGEIGENAETLVKFLEDVPGTPKHDGMQNPATYMLDVIGGTVQSNRDYAEAYRESDLCRRNQEELNGLVQDTRGLEKITRKYPTSLLTQLKALFVRFIKSLWRSPNYSLIRFLVFMFTALILGSVFFQIDTTTQTGAFSSVGAQFNAFMFVGTLHVMSVQPFVAAERAAYYRERAIKMYQPFMYNLSITFAELPFLIIQTLLFTTIFYWMVGLDADVGKFFFWWLVYFLYISFAAFFGYMWGVLLKTQEMAAAVANLCIAIWALFAGFLVPRPSIPAPYLFLYYFNPITYALQAVWSSQYYCEGDTTTCPSLTIVDPTTGAMSTVTRWNYLNGLFDLKYDARWWYVLIVFGFLLGTRIITGIGLAKVNHQSR